MVFKFFILLGYEDIFREKEFEIIFFELRRLREMEKYIICGLEYLKYLV